MKRIFSIIFLLFLCFHTSLMAQRTMNTLNNQFGSSANGLDRNQYDRNEMCIRDRGWADSQDMLIIRFGDQMNNVAVTDGDKVEAEQRMGYRCV